MTPKQRNRYLALPKECQLDGLEYGNGDWWLDKGCFPIRERRAEALIRDKLTEWLFICDTTTAVQSCCPHSSSDKWAVRVEVEAGGTNSVIHGGYATTRLGALLGCVEEVLDEREPKVRGVVERVPALDQGEI